MYLSTSPYSAIHFGLFERYLLHKYCLDYRNNLHTKNYSRSICLLVCLLEHRNMCRILFRSGHSDIYYSNILMQLYSSHLKLNQQKLNKSCHMFPTNIYLSCKIDHFSSSHHPCPSL